jgi:hypothetical protein
MFEPSDRETTALLFDADPKGRRSRIKNASRSEAETTAFE